jgi:predicted metal-dependent hydrolase
VSHTRDIAVRAPDGRTLSVQLHVNARARRISLKVDPTQRVAIAVAPSARKAADAARFAQDRASWIADRLDQLPAPAPFVDGGTIPFRGNTLALVRLDGRKPAVFTLDGAAPSLAIGAAPDRFAFAVRRALAKEALGLFTAACAHHGEALGRPAPIVSLKDTRSRWGSCTRDGRISLSWRLIAAPDWVWDYVCAHEAAHLVEMNHSPRYWALVARLTPHATAARSWLKRHGPALHGLGAA